MPELILYKLQLFTGNPPTTGINTKRHSCDARDTEETPALTENRTDPFPFFNYRALCPIFCNAACSFAPLNAFFPTS